MNTTSARLDVEEEHDHDDADKGQRALEESHDPRADQLVERVDVVRDPRDQHAWPVSGEETDRHLLQMGEDPQPQVLQRSLADPSDEVGLDVARSPEEKRGADERGHDHVEFSDRRVVRGDLRGRRSDQQRWRQGRARRHEQPDEHHRPPACGTGAAGRAATAPCVRAGPRRESAAKGRRRAARSRAGGCRRAGRWPPPAPRPPAPCARHLAPRRAASARSMRSRRTARRDRPVWVLTPVGSQSRANSSRSSRSRCR